jgi:beta-phosphoglucomutase
MADFAPPRAVIFDMDGVLTDSEPLINEAAIAMFGELGLEVAPNDFIPFIGTGEDRYLSGVAEKHGFRMHLASAKKRTYEIYLSLVPHRLRAFAGAVQLVQRCRDAGFKIAVASSADRIKIEANLRQIGLPPESWDALVSGDDVQHKKPAPDLYLAAAQTLGLVPAECVVIEDAPNGIQAAQSAGIRCIAVAQTFLPGELALADLVRPTVADITLEDLRGATRLTSLPPPIRGDLTAPSIFTTPRRILARPWGFWATLGLGLLIAGGILLVQLAVGISLGIAAGMTDGMDWIDPNNLESNGFFWALVTLVTTPVTVGLVVLAAWFKPGVSIREYLALRPVSRRRLIRWCLVLLAFALLVDLTTVLLQQPIVPEVMVEAYRTAGWPPLLWIAVVLGAPVGEELFFRGFLFKGWVHSPLGAWGTVVTTSVIWAIIHQQYDLHGILIIFAAGILLGYSRLRSGSIYPAIVMHAFMNILAMTQTAIFFHYFD